MGSTYRRRWLPALLVLAVAGEVAAQQAPPPTLPPVGTRVRITALGIRGERFTGRITEFPQDSVQLDTTGTRTRLGFETGPVLVEQYRLVTIPTNLIDKVETSGGRTRRKSTTKGALLGALVGAVIWGIGNLPELNPGFDDFVKGAPVGAIVGGVVGGGIGYLFAGERWERYPPPPPPSSEVR